MSGRVAATTMAKRQGPTAVGVTEKQLRPTKGRIYGNLYLPRHITGRRPAVLVVSGSAGGLTTTMAAALLAAHGYPSLALAYFKAPVLPQTLSSIPLEYFTSALEELRAQPGVDRNHVLVAGESRGGEAALLLGAHFPRLVNGVIAGVPSSVVNPGWPDTSNPAWTVRGRPSRPSARPARGRRSSRWSASAARSCSPQGSRTGSGRPAPMSTPSPSDCAPKGLPIR